MTKDDLVTAVVKSCKGDDLSKRLVSDVIDATFESVKFLLLSYFTPNSSLTVPQVYLGLIDKTS